MNHQRTSQWCICGSAIRLLMLPDTPVFDRIDKAMAGELMPNLSDAQSARRVRAYVGVARSARAGRHVG